ncbi:MAG: YcjX family protein, partial [Oceanospirillum sp.]|nr:YcjX family protein [Oceanospirillum sp.]
MVKRYLKSAGKQLGSKIGKQLGEKIGKELIRHAENLTPHKRHRMGVTGFSRAGKTVLITQLTHSLLRVDEPLPEGVSRHPLTGLDLFDAGLLKPALLKEDKLARRSQFDFFRHRDSLMGQGRWPEPTQDLTWLDLEIKRPQKQQALQNLISADSLHLEIMDYPGEWLADLALPEQSFSQWSDSAWELAQQPHREKLSEPFRQLIAEAAEQQQVSDALQRKLTDAWKDYLIAARAEGYVLNQPSRVLVPGQMQNYSMLGFFPVPDHLQLPKLQKSMSRLFDAYKQEIE